MKKDEMVTGWTAKTGREFGLSLRKNYRIPAELIRSNKFKKLLAKEKNIRLVPKGKLTLAEVDKVRVSAWMSGHLRKQDRPVAMLIVDAFTTTTWKQLVTGRQRTKTKAANKAGTPKKRGYNKRAPVTGKHPIADRIQELMDKNGIKGPTALGEAMGIAVSSPIEWVSGRREPKDKSIARLAKFFNVDAEWIKTGVKEPKQLSFEFESVEGDKEIADVIAKITSSVASLATKVVKLEVKINASHKDTEKDYTETQLEGFTVGDLVFVRRGGSTYEAQITGLKRDAEDFVVATVYIEELKLTARYSIIEKDFNLTESVYLAGQGSKPTNTQGSLLSVGDIVTARIGSEEVKNCVVTDVLLKDSGDPYSYRIYRRGNNTLHEIMVGGSIYLQPEGIV